ncbi:MAG: ATP phosphoribosyltransferase [Thermoanaerobaculia bacterium]|nr:ATP phosphoribosyltransferase [Thermoanaerobaculia bacterium]
MLRIAIQKSGRLFEDSIALLRDAGIAFGNSPNRLRSQASNFPLEIIYLRDDDIPEYVEGGVVDAGIVGENVVLEKRKTVRVVDRLGFGKCRLSIALSKGTPYRSVQDLNRLRIATTYRHVLADFLAANGIQADVHEVSGAVELAPSLGLADAIFDIVGTGSTLLANGLYEVETVLHSEALLVADPALTREKQEVLDRLLFRIQANRNAKNHRYILLNAPNEKLSEIARLLPGMKSPTVLPLATEGWSSLHSVVQEDVFWEVLEQLKAAGAQGILVAPIERMIL